MVTGGLSYSNAKMDTTEIFRNNKWNIVAGKLPVPMESLSIATINDRVILFGKIRNGMAEWWAVD